MCGRFALTKPPAALADALGTRFDGAAFEPRYNIAPTQRVVAAVNDEERSIAKLCGGLIPGWSHRPADVTLSTFNARVETIATSRVNLSSGIYHYAGERWYGNTRNGAYVCEREAESAGDRATENGQ